MAHELYLYNIIFALSNQNLGDGYYVFGLFEFLITDGGVVILSCPLFQGDVLSDLYNYPELFPAIPKEDYNDLFIQAMYDNNISMLKKLYQHRSHLDDIKTRDFSIYSRNEEAVQFAITRFPQQIAYKVSFTENSGQYLHDIEMPNNLTFIRHFYETSKRPISVYDYLSSEDEYGDLIKPEILMWYRDKGENLNEIVENWLDNEGNWPFAITPSVEALKYLLETTGNYSLGNRLRFYFYDYAKVEANKWYDYIDNILIRKGIPVDLEELCYLGLSDPLSRDFLIFLYEKYQCSYADYGILSPYSDDPTIEFYLNHNYRFSDDAMELYSYRFINGHPRSKIALRLLKYFHTPRLQEKVASLILYKYLSR